MSGYVTRPPRVHYRWRDALPDVASATGDIFVMGSTRDAVFADGSVALCRVANRVQRAFLHFIVPPWVTRLFERPLQIYHTAVQLEAGDTLQVDADINDASCATVFGDGVDACAVINALKLDVCHDDVCAYLDGRNPNLVVFAHQFSTANFNRTTFGLATYAAHTPDRTSNSRVPVSHDLFWWTQPLKSPYRANTSEELQRRFDLYVHIWRWGRQSYYAEFDSRDIDDVIEFLNTLNPHPAYVALGCHVTYMFNHRRDGVVVQCTNRYARTCLERLEARFGDAIHDYGRRSVWPNSDSWNGFLSDADLDVRCTSTCWEYVHRTTVCACLGLAALHLPPYVMLAIVDWLPQMWTMKRFVKISVIEHFVASARRAKQKRIQNDNK